MPIKVVPSPEFEVGGPFEVPLLKDAKLPAIDVTLARKKLAASTWGERHGCYVFALFRYGVPKPWYIGKAAKTEFGTEVFNDSNCKKYAEAIAIDGAGTPHVYFVNLPAGKKGPTNEKAIERLETRLIEYCAGVNPDIRNKRKIEVYELRIKGVMNLGQGRPTNAATHMKKMMGLS